MAGGRPDHPAPAFAMGRLGRYPCKRSAVAIRWPEGIAGAANGTIWASLPRLRELPGLSQVECVADVLLDRCLLRDAARWRARHVQWHAQYSQAHDRRKSRIAADPHPHGSRRRPHRWRAGNEKPQCSAGRADQVWLPGGFMADAGIAGTVARWAMTIDWSRA